MRLRLSFVLFSVGAILLLTANNASAYWSTRPGSVAGTSATGQQSVPSVTATSPSAGTVSVSWSASSGANTSSAYYVTKTTGSTTSAACGTSATVTTTALTCSDTGLAGGVSYIYTVYASALSWSASGASAAVSVLRTPAKLAFATQPGGSVLGSPLAPQPVVAIQDASGAVVTQSTTPVTLTLLGGPVGAVLTCGANPAGAVAGVVSFSGCTVSLAGTYQLVATGAGFTVTSSSFTVAPRPSSQLAFTTSPTDSYTATAFYTQPVVAVEDSTGAVVATDASTITLTITTPAGAALSCTGGTAKAAAAGVSSFAGCAITTAGTYTLTASDGSLTAAVSTSFKVIAPPVRLVWSATSTTCTASSGSIWALTYTGCKVGDTFTGSISLTDSTGTTMIANLLGPITVTVTLQTTGASVTRTIAHGATTSNASITFTDNTGGTDAVTATAPAPPTVSSAMATFKP
jgi:hypothetical protein